MRTRINDTRPGDLSLIGCCGILNVGDGDTKLSFDPANPAEKERAAKIVADMLKRGFAIMVQVGEKDGKPLFQRAEAFDEATCEYLIVGLPEDMLENGQPPKPLKLRGRKGRHRTYTAPAGNVRSVAVARSAGG